LPLHCLVQLRPVPLLLPLLRRSWERGNHVDVLEAAVRPQRSCWRKLERCSSHRRAAGWLALDGVSRKLEPEELPRQDP